MRRILRDRSNSSAAMCVVQVVFINDQTGEYQYYEIQFRAVRPGVMATIKLSTTTRQRKQHTLMLENPLATAVTFNATCNVADLQIPSQTSVPAQSEVQCHLLFIWLSTSGSFSFTQKVHFCAAEKTHICAVKMCAKTRLRPGLWRNLQCPKPPRLDLGGVSRIRDRAKDGDGKGKEEVCEGHRRWWRTGCEGLGCVVLKNPFILILTVIMLLFYIFFYI